MSSEFLSKIIDRQKQIVEQRQDFLSLADIKKEAAKQFAVGKSRKGFVATLWLASPLGFIAEMKKASPSAGLLREDYDPTVLAISYEEGGASCLSILTNEFFQGTDEHLRQVREATNLPIIRKDFIISEYQVYETYSLGADAMLLIAACLTDEEMHNFAAKGLNLGMDILLEAHNREEAEVCLSIAKSLDSSGRVKENSPGALMLGVNNRNLHNFEVDLSAGAKLLSHLKKNCDYLLVGESGIKNAQDIVQLQQAGAMAFLIGESFMHAPDPGKALSSFTEGIIP